MLENQHLSCTDRGRRIYVSLKVFAVAALTFALPALYPFLSLAAPDMRAEATNSNASATNVMRAVGGGTGIVEICKKASGSGLENKVFQFQVTGIQNLVPVPVGGCSPPLEVPIGMVTVSEARSGFYTNRTGTFSGGFQLLDVSLARYDESQPNPLKNKNLYAMQATLEVREGGLYNQTVIEFTNAFAAEAWIEICNRADDAPSTQANAAGYAFNGFQPNHQVLILPGTCGLFKVYLPSTPDAPSPATGTARITQFYKPGFTLETVSTNPPERFNSLTLGTAILDHRKSECLFAPDPSVVAGCTADSPHVAFVDVDVVEGLNPATATKVSFNNRFAGTRNLKICKIAGAGVAVGTPFTFDITVDGAAADEIVAPVTVAAGDEATGGNCVVSRGLDSFGSFPVNSTVTVIERAANGVALSAVGSPTGTLFNINLAQRKATIPIGDGINTLTFTNITAAPISAPTTTGTNVSFAPTTNLNVTFGSVSAAGDTTVSIVPPEQQQPLPSSFALSGSALVYQITTTAVFSGNITVSFDVPNVADAAACRRLRLLRYTSQWDASNNAAPQYNAATHICTVSQTVANLSSAAHTESFAQATASVFAVAQLLAPTAANGSISGRAVTERGRGISGVVVTLTDSGGATRTARTTAFGHYRFEAVATGETYVVTARAKRFAFAPSSHVLALTENAGDINFIADAAPPN